MRLRLHQEWATLETILAEPHDTILAAQNLATERGMRAAQAVLRRLEAFSYIHATKATLEDERVLQSRYSSVLERYHRAVGDAVPMPGENHAQRVEEANARARELFAQTHVFSEDAQRAALELLSIVELVARHGRSRVAREPARWVLQRIVEQARSEQTMLVQHIHTALARIPSALRHRGRSAAEAAQLTSDYAAGCVSFADLLERIATQASATITALPPLGTELVVRAASRELCDGLASTLASYGTIERLELVPYLLLRTGEREATELLYSKRPLEAGTQIRRAYPYAVRPRRARPRDTPWHLELVGAPAAWSVSRGSGRSIAIVDSGVDYTHPDLMQRFGTIIGEDFVDGGDPYDENGHGTHVAGIVAGERTGVAPAANLYAVRVLDSDGSGSETAVLKGIEWAILRGVDAINLSLGSAFGSDAEAALVAAATQRGILVACAAGNDGDGSYTYPASHPAATSVAAVDENKQRAPFSNYNDRLALSAPGVAITSTWPGGGYASLSGTSMATPHVAGAAALLPRGQAREALERTAEKLGEQRYYGAGLIQLGDAVHERIPDHRNRGNT